MFELEALVKRNQDVEPTFSCRQKSGIRQATRSNASGGDYIVTWNASRTSDLRIRLRGCALDQEFFGQFEELHGLFAFHRDKIA